MQLMPMPTRRCALVALFFALGAGTRGSDEGSTLSADKALSRLLAGNARFVAHKEQHPDESPARRQELVSAQHPFAVILGCADSRVPPELLFDEGLGDLFVIRVAGNIVDDAVLGSIEYAVEHLGTKLIVVLGHEKCGAVSAAVASESASGHLSALVAAIRPAVAATASSPGDRIHNCVVENVRRVTRQIQQSEPILKEAKERDGVKVIAADYELDSGRVRLLDSRLSAGK
jgi:carbonic anhydrase